jgi:hypothetical protein
VLWYNTTDPTISFVNYKFSGFYRTAERLLYDDTDPSFDQIVKPEEYETGIMMTITITGDAADKNDYIIDWGTFIFNINNPDESVTTFPFEVRLLDITFRENGYLEYLGLESLEEFNKLVDVHWVATTPMQRLICASNQVGTTVEISANGESYDIERIRFVLWYNTTDPTISFVNYEFGKNLDVGQKLTYNDTDPSFPTDIKPAKYDTGIMITIEISDEVADRNDYTTHWGTFVFNINNPDESVTTFPFEVRLLDVTFRGQNLKLFDKLVDVHWVATKRHYDYDYVTVFGEDDRNVNKTVFEVNLTNENRDDIKENVYRVTNLKPGNSYTLTTIVKNRGESIIYEKVKTFWPVDNFENHVDYTQISNILTTIDIECNVVYLNDISQTYNINCNLASIEYRGNLYFNFYIEIPTKGFFKYSPNVGPYSRDINNKFTIPATIYNYDEENKINTYYSIIIDNAYVSSHELIP